MRLPELFLLVMSFLVPLAVGWRVLDFFDKKRQLALLERIFLALGLGFGCVTWIMFCGSWAGIGFDAVRAVFSIVAILSIGAYWKGNSLKGAVESVKNKISAMRNLVVSPAVLGIVLFILFNIAVVLIRTMLVEFDVWDSWFKWAFKAKIFYHHGIVPLDLYKQFNSAWGDWYQPLHVPLMETWILLWQGYWNDYLTRALFPVFHAGLCVLGFSFLREYISPLPALIGTSFLASLYVLQWWTIGTIAEPILLFYYLASVTLLFRWQKEFDSRMLFLSAIFAGITILTKVEGWVLIASNLGLIVYCTFPKFGFRQAFVAVSQYLLIIVAVIAPWSIFKFLTNISDDYVSYAVQIQFQNSTFHLSNWAKIPHMFAHHFSDLKFWNILWLMTAFAVLYNLAYKKNKRASTVLLVIALQVFFYSCGYIVLLGVLGNSEAMFRAETMQRLLLAPAIMSVFYSCMVLSKN